MNIWNIFLSLTLGGSVLALLLLLGKRFVFKKLSNTFYYYAWLVVLLRFLVPLPGAMPTAPRQIPARETAAVTEPTAPRETYPLETTAAQEAPTQVDAAPAGSSGKTGQGISLRKLLPMIWAAGALASFGWYVLSYWKFVVRARRSVTRELLWENAGQFQGLWQKPRLLLAKNLESPMLVGLVQPKILLPEGSYTEEMLQNILLHELVHFRRNDIIYKWFSVAVFSIQWFNPLTYVIRRELGRACELSCDEWVIRHMSAPEKQTYGETLIAMAAAKPLPAAAGATTFSTEKRDLKRRLLAIMGYRNTKLGVLLGLGAAVVLTALGLLLGPEQLHFPRANYLGQPDMDLVKTVTVSNVEDFLGAIGPNRDVRLRSGAYNLLDAQDYGQPTKSPYYSWEPVFDGYQLVIHNVQNLSIRGEIGTKTQILAAPRYANVLYFRNSSNLWLQDLTLGHSPQEGYCSGGVLHFENCRQADGGGLYLFGCGSVAVTAQGSKNLTVHNSDLYDCTYNALTMYNSTDVLVDSCHIYDMNCLGPLVELKGCTGATVQNCLIENSVASRLLETGDGEGKLVFAYNTVQNCSFEQEMLQTKQETQIEGCNFRDISTSRWETTDSAASLPMETTPETEPEPPQEPVEPQEVTVSTVDALLAAIAPNTTVYLEPGTYDLTYAATYGEPGLSGSYRWSEAYDGWELTIQADGVRLIGKGDVEVVTQPRYANVLHFENCRDFQVQGLTLGHTPEQGSCAGHVIRMDGCSNGSVDSCDLYGCGTIGILAIETRDVTVQNSTIHDCSEGGLYLRMCARFTVKDSRFRNIDNAAGSLYSPLFDLVGCQEISLGDLQVEDCTALFMLKAETCRALTLQNTAFSGNTFTYLASIRGESPVLSNCTFRDTVELGYYETDQSFLDGTGQPITEEQLKVMNNS